MTATLATQMTDEVKAWMLQIEYARKREKDFRAEGRRINAIYEAEKREEYQFNILFSNTETMAPALYNSVPRPVVDRRFKNGEDPVGRLAAQTTQHVLEFLVDSSYDDYSTFDDMMRQAVLEALLPGRGVTRFKYEATFSPMPGGKSVADLSEEDSSDALGEQTGDNPAEKVDTETVCGEEVPWDRFLCGYAKKWKDVPWVAFEHFMNKEELKQNFSAELAELIPLPVTGGNESVGDEDGEEEKVREAEGEKFAHIYELWDKAKREVIFLAAGYGSVVKRVNDPLGLSEFFPCPKPLSLMAKVSTLVPTAPYLMYEEQAKELSYITRRINKIMRALKVRGFYDSTLEGLSELMKAEDNTLMPAENVSAMLQGQTLDKAIWYFPIEKLVSVLQQLYLQRQQVKDTIYEITGISDILRGAAAASETATASNIKNQWGTLRLKRLQKEVQRYARDCLRIMAEIAVTKLRPQTIAAMTGLNFPTNAQKQQAQMVAQQAQQQAQAQAAMQAQQPPQPGQPPAPPPQPPALPPQITQALSSPTWEDVLGLLSNGIQRAYRIDIETNSTVDDAATEDKQNIAEFLNALSQFLNGVAPMVQEGILPFDAAKAMLLAVARRFRFGDEVEDQLAQMQPPAPQPGSDNGAAEKKQQAQLDLQMKQSDAQAQQQELAMKARISELDSQNKMAEMQRKEQLAIVEHNLKLQEAELRRQEIMLKQSMPAESNQAKGES